MRWPERFLWLLGLAPPAIALSFATGADAASPGAVLNLLGRLAGIGGLSLFLVAAILSSRVPGFDRRFGGLTHLWKVHHRLGGIAFLLILAHPLLLALAAAEVSLEAAARTLAAPRADWALWSGWAGLIVLTIVLAPSFSFFGDPEYQRWRRLHRLAVVAMIAAIVHTFLGTRSIPEPLNALIWAGLVLAAFAAVAYRLVFSRRIGGSSYVVADVAHPANDIVELTLEPRGAKLEFRPGQFAYFTPYDSELEAGRGEEHPYTLSSAPGEERLRVAVKALGDATRALQSVRPGSPVRVEGPYGDFFHRTDPARAELWIAGGIGIAPFLARARDIAHKARAGAEAPETNVHLIYCVNDESRAHFSDELRALASTLAGFAFTLHYFYREGPLRHEFLSEHCPDFASRELYVCGPEALTGLAARILTAAGAPRTRIHSEEFTLL